MMNERVAFHEAGHAVVAHALGFRSDGMKVWFEENRGYTAQQPPSEDDLVKMTLAQSAEHLKTYLSVQAAGHAAESILAGQDPYLRPIFMSGAITDFQQATETAMAVYGAESAPTIMQSNRAEFAANGEKRVRFLLHEAMEKAVTMLRQPKTWAKVQKLARALIAQATDEEPVGTLSGEDVDAILDAA